MHHTLIKTKTEMRSQNIATLKGVVKTFELLGIQSDLVMVKSELNTLSKPGLPEKLKPSCLELVCIIDCFTPHSISPVEIIVPLGTNLLQCSNNGIYTE